MSDFKIKEIAHKENGRHSLCHSVKYVMNDKVACHAVIKASGSADIDNRSCYDLCRDRSRI